MLVAGNPKDQIEALQAAGVQGFIHIFSDADPDPDRVAGQAGDEEQPMRPDFSKIDYQPAAAELATPAGPARRRAGVEDRRAHPGEGLVHGRRPVRHGAPGLRRRRCRPSCAARTPPCTPCSRGPSASTPASPPPRNRTPSTAAIWRPARRASRWPSTWPRIAATIPTTSASSGDVGKAGVAIDSVEDMKILFDQIPLGPDVGLDDHERRGAADHGVLHRGRRRAGRRRRSSSAAPFRTTF